MRIVVTSAAGNAVGYAAKCVRSVARQTTGYGPSGEGRSLHHWFSASDPATCEDALQAGAEEKAELYAENAEGGSLERLVPLWRSLAPETVVVWLDGDDTLTGPHVVERVARFYELSDDVWLTYGSFIRDDGAADYQVAPQFGRRYLQAPRSSSFRATHLRTFRAGLFQHVPEHHLRAEHGFYYNAAPDVAVMTSMLELAAERYFVATDPLCVWNYEHAARGPEAVQRQRADVLSIGKHRPLEPLKDRPW
jgi:hypothetical protein